VNLIDPSGLGGWRPVRGKPGWEWRRDKSAGGGDPRHRHYRHRGREYARRVYDDGSQCPHGEQGIDKDVPDDVIHATNTNPFVDLFADTVLTMISATVQDATYFSPGGIAAAAGALGGAAAAPVLGPVGRILPALGY
jgi:hypothetical protein